MEDKGALNGSSSYELTGDKLVDLPTVSSLKSSLASLFRSSIPKINSKTKSVCISKNEDYSTELCEDDIDEYCEKKNVADFQKNYLELGQWPEIPVQKYNAFKIKYRNMKQKLKECKMEKNKAEAKLRKLENWEIQCKSCDSLRMNNNKTKLALEQAVQLSNILLQEVRRMELENENLPY